MKEKSYIEVNKEAQEYLNGLPNGKVETTESLEEGNLSSSSILYKNENGSFSLIVF